MTLKYGCENNTFSPNILLLVGIAQSSRDLFWRSSAQIGPPAVHFPEPCPEGFRTSPGIESQ